MDIRRQFWMAVCAALLVCGGAAMAQEAGGEMPGRPEKHYKPVPLSPEKSARHTTDRMDSLLNLTEKQYKKLYKLNLKWAREDTENKAGAPRMGGRPDGAPGFDRPDREPRGQRPPEGMEGRRPPRDFTPSGDREDMEEQRVKMEKQRKKREKKLKKVLTDGQYTRWMEERHPAMPEGRKDGKREAE
ncbi:DUF4890 domain-containing protein [Bacteroides fragilis]|nr:DUF4890 domain-containing protein [Bacteroides fragilis]MCE8651108.1 DUF4890 domain-containing protein [Bacteroides fragilis]